MREAVKNDKFFEKKQKALSVSIKEGSAASVSSGLGDSFIVPYAVDALKASSFQVGLLSSIGSLISPFSQLLGSRMMRHSSRKSIVTRFVFLQSLVWLPVAFLSYLAYRGILPDFLPYFLIAIYAIMVILAGIHYPAWFSWMGDLVPDDQRGRFFSKRNLILGIIGLAVALIGSIILKFTKAQDLLFLGFSVLFIGAFISKIISFIYLKKQYEPKLNIPDADYFSFWAFLKRFDNYGKFAVYQALFNFAIMIASPFFAVYMLKNLGMENNYVLYMIISLSSTGFYLAFAPLVGKFSDKYGNLRLMYVANAAFVLTPLAWIFIKSPLLLILIPQLISGVANAAFGIAFSNFTYDSVRPTKRGLAVAYSNILVGLGGFLGSLIGGFLITYVSFSINAFFAVFILASLTRLAVGLFMLPRLQEVRKVRSMPAHHISLLHPVRTIYSEVHWIKTIIK